MSAFSFHRNFHFHPNPTPLNSISPSPFPIPNLRFPTPRLPLSLPLLLNTIQLKFPPPPQNPNPKPKIDILINAAGLTHASPLITTSPSLIENILQTNLMGTIWGCKIIGKEMLRRREGIFFFHFISFPSSFPIPLPSPLSSHKTHKEEIPTQHQLSPLIKKYRR